MNNSNLFITIALLSPIIVTLLTIFFSSYRNIRDILGIFGGIISFISSIKIAQNILSGEVQRILICNIYKDLDILFNVTSLGAIFGHLCSGLWILAAIY